jgi:hypothetical protein
MIFALEIVITRVRLNQEAVGCSRIDRDGETAIQPGMTGTWNVAMVGTGGAATHDPRDVTRI